MKDIDKVREIIELSELKGQLIVLNKVLGKEIDNCRDFTVSQKFSIDFGIDRGSLLASVLEKYHLFMLKEDDIR